MRRLVLIFAGSTLAAPAVVAVPAFPLDVEFEHCWDGICSGSTNTWTLAADGTFQSGPISGTWSADVPARTFTLSTNLGVTYWGVHQAGTCVRGEMENAVNGRWGTWHTVGCAP